MVHDDVIRMAPLDITGQRYGRLVAIAYSKTVNGRRLWRCRCDCGNEGDYSLSAIRSGNTQSCGCYQLQRASEGNITHGYGRKSDRRAEYRIWRNMKNRCFNTRTAAYAGYGARGITVCDRWRCDFAAFLADMGPRPSAEHSIDRINNDGNYEPGNCRWATATTQRRNRSDSKTTEAMVRDIRDSFASGEPKLRIAKRFGLSHSYIASIVNRECWKDVP